MPYLEYNDPYFAISAINVLTHSGIRVEPEDGKICFAKKDEQKVKDIIKKLHWDVKILQDK